MSASKGKRLAEQEYKKELRRIKQFIKRKEKQGFKFSEMLFLNNLKRITEASVRKLQRRTSSVILGKATQVPAFNQNFVKKSTQNIKPSKGKKITQKNTNIQIGKTQTDNEELSMNLPDQSTIKYDAPIYYEFKDKEGVTHYVYNKDTVGYYKGRQLRRLEREQKERKKQHQKEIEEYREWLEQTGQRQTYLQTMMEQYGFDSDIVKEYLDKNTDKIAEYNELMKTEKFKSQWDRKRELERDFNEAMIVIQNVEYELNLMRETNSMNKAVDITLDTLFSLIKDKGIENVAQNIVENSDDLMYYARACIRYSDKDGNPNYNALHKMIQCIDSSPLSKEEWDKINDAINDYEEGEGYGTWY